MVLSTNFILGMFKTIILFPSLDLSDEENNETKKEAIISEILGKTILILEVSKGANINKIG